MTDDDRYLNLPARQRTAVDLLLAGTPAIDVARQVDCSERTLRRWRSAPDFNAASRERAREVARQANTALLAAQHEAVDTLRAALRSGSPATRVRAARSLLEVGARAAADDLTDRLEALERRYQGWRDDGMTLTIYNDDSTGLSA